MTLFLLAIFAGFLTVLAPCILPILPIVLGAGTGSRWRPVFVVIGFILSFSVFGAAFATVGTFIGISNETFRWIAVALLIVFGASLLFERTYQKITAAASARLGQLGAKVSAGSVGKTSAFSGLLVGISLGLIWTPCAGPILGTILTLAATNGNPWTVGLLFAAYGLGASVPMLGIAYGGGWILSQIKKIGAKAETLNKLFGLLIIATALAIASGYDRVIQSYLVSYYPSQLTQLEQGIVPQTDLPNLGSMPEFQGIEGWINSEPLTTDALRGKVVLVDFWTYSCINCIRTFPYLKDWWSKYKDDGLVIIGVHTPEFEFEKDFGNVRAAAEQFDLRYPIALDNAYATWNAYRNHYWPATYIFDRNGVLRYTHHGEGNYDATESTIQELLGVQGNMTREDLPAFESIRSPETYFGWGRGERFASPEAVVPDQRATYTIPNTVAKNEWALDGLWTIKEEYSEASEPGASLLFRFEAPIANFVLSPPGNGSGDVNVYVDGKFIETITVDRPSLYEVWSWEAGEHDVRLDVLDPGIKVYTITFGA